ncbi:MAG: M20/M25/M40 family metallo-hydrolase [Myxococcota bacterium]|jgi:acetylornithine deacetylase/succinyl-diaminopimelate desuccinylase-like protein|nr:M20/M25/M40 family metallo-hydrolase [Myxococcota bacterium]
MDGLIHRSLREDIMPVEVLQAVRDVLARDSRPGQPIGATIDYLMDRLFYGEFHIFEQVASSRYSDYVNLIGTKDPGTGEAPLWLVAHLGSGVAPTPSVWDQTGGDPIAARIDSGAGWLYGLGAANAKVDIILKLLAAAQVDTERLKRPICLIGLSGEEGHGPGVTGLLDGRLPTPAAAVIGAPTNLELWTDHPGSVTVRLTAHRTVRHRRMPPCRGMFELVLTGRSAHAQRPGAGEDALAQGLAVLRRLREHGDLRVLSFEAGEASNRLAGRCRMQLATSFDEMPSLGASVVAEPLPDGASVPFPIDKMLQGWLKARDAGVDAVREQLGGGRCVGVSRPKADVHTGWLRSDRDELAGELTLWTGPGVDQRAIMEAFARAAHVQIDRLDELELDVEVVQERPAFVGAETAGAFLDVGRAALTAAGLPPVVSGGRYVSDAGQLTLAGVPTLLFGPGRGLGDMYRDDERVPLKHLVSAYRVYESLIEQYCC